MPELDLPTIRAYVSKYLHLPWQIIDDKRLRLQFDLMSFDESIVLVNHIAKVANRFRHHPNIHIYYNSVLIDLYTHDVDGITDRDLRLATEIEKIV